MSYTVSIVKSVLEKLIVAYLVIFYLSRNLNAYYVVYSSLSLDYY
jgi:hypothetical protein